jgi:hypothetical protein
VTVALAQSRSGNRKIGDAATTYAAQVSCPRSCPFFDGGGCYAESGRLGVHTNRLNEAAAAEGVDAIQVALHEALAIAGMEVVLGRPMRLHTVGDCASDLAARIVSRAAEAYMDAGGGPVWTYTHAWREVERESWGRVSVLASCETAEDVALARERGYAPSIVVEEFADRRLYSQKNADLLQKDELRILPCPAQTRERVTCSSCRLCMDDAGILARGYAIGFELHGTPFTRRQALKALRTPDDPDRKLTSRELIPRFVAAYVVTHRRVPTRAEIARGLDLNRSSVNEMLASLTEAA